MHIRTLLSPYNISRLLQQAKRHEPIQCFICRGLVLLKLIGKGSKKRKTSQLLEAVARFLMATAAMTGPISYHHGSDLMLLYEPSKRAGGLNPMKVSLNELIIYRTCWHQYGADQNKLICSWFFLILMSLDGISTCKRMVYWHDELLHLLK